MSGAWRVSKPARDKRSLRGPGRFTTADTQAAVASAAVRPAHGVLSNSPLSAHSMQ